MATESTAIVNLVDLVRNKPLPRDAADDTLFGGKARFDPMAMPVQAQPVMLPQPQTQPQLKARVHAANMPGVAFDLKSFQARDERANPMKKYALPVGLFAVAMVLLSIYLAKSGHKPAPKATVVHAPAPTVQMPAVQPAAPTPAPEAVAAAAPAAPTVTPIDSAQPTVTPIEPAAAAAPEPTVAAAEPTVPEPTVPTVADAAPADDAAPAEAAPAPAPSKHHHRRAAARSQTKRETRVATAEPKPAKLEKLGGKGALQVSSSPARELWVDGRDTKHMTPQRVTLTPGTHNITLFDNKTRSAKTFQVEIKANQTTRVSKSY